MIATSIHTANLQAIWPAFQTTTAKREKEREKEKRKESQNSREMNIMRAMRELMGLKAESLNKMFKRSFPYQRRLLKKKNN